MGPVDNSPERLLRIVVAIVGIAVLILFLGVAASAMARHPGETTELRGAKLHNPLGASAEALPGSPYPVRMGDGHAPEPGGWLDGDWNPGSPLDALIEFPGEGQSEARGRGRR